MQTAELVANVESLYGYNEIKRALNAMLPCHRTIPLADGNLLPIPDGVAVVTVGLPKKSEATDNVCIVLDNEKILMTTVDELQELTRHVMQDRQPWYWGDVNFTLV